MKHTILNNQKIYPSKVVCIGRNYLEHIKELNNEKPEEMVFFLKPNSAISTELSFPKNQKTCHYEAELSFLIKDDKIYAIAFGLDLTLREVQTKLKQKGLPWERAKAFDNSAVFSDFILFDGDISKLRFELYINNQLVQEANSNMMINSVEEILSEAKTFLTFENNDILMSGTPKGVGTFKKGDVFIGKIFSDKILIINKEFIVT